MLINLLARDGWIGMSYSCLVRRGNELVDCDRERERVKHQSERRKRGMPDPLVTVHEPSISSSKGFCRKGGYALGSKCGFRPRNSHLSRGFLLVREEEEEEE